MNHVPMLTATFSLYRRRCSIFFDSRALSLTGIRTVWRPVPNGEAPTTNACTINVPSVHILIRHSEYYDITVVNVRSVLLSKHASIHLYIHLFGKVRITSPSLCSAQL